MESGFHGLADGGSLHRLDVGWRGYWRFCCRP
jgi:hypothetical protein